LLILQSDADQKTEDAQKFDPIQDLFFWLHKSTQDNTATSFGRLKRITPLGWTLLWGVLGNYIPHNVIEQFENTDTTFKEIVSVLASCEPSPDVTDDVAADPPWGSMIPIVNKFNENDFADKLFRFLNEDDERRGLDILQHEHTSFDIHGFRGQEKEVTLAHKKYSMPQWTIIEGRFQKDRDYETVKEKQANIKESAVQKHLFRWSETLHKGELLSISTIARGLASACGLDKLDIFGNQLLPSEKQSDEVQKDNDILVSEISHDDNHDSDKNIGANNENDDNNSASSSSLHSTDIPKEPFNRDKINELLAMQRTFWRSRSHKYRNHVRVALLQWRVDDTYYHPIFDLSEEKRETVKSSHETRLEESAIELRRRRIIEAALDACDAFDVDILLLPEYSVRPETLQYIWKNLPISPRSNSDPSKNDYRGTVVWAGTFRKPPEYVGIRIDGYLRQLFSAKPAQSSILSVINPTGIGDQIFVRGKKYPSLAADEIFYPDTQPYEPLFKQGNLFKQDDISSSSQFIPWVYTLELICSESFLATSPSNLLSIAKSCDMLLRKFGVTSKGYERMKGYVSGDLTQFSNYTSLNSGKLFRRTILLVPAMSTRAQDYTLLGQSLYLSTGITTVFCNAVNKKHGHGRSCFIGYDCWDIDTEKPKEPIDRGPYHGVFPGIFQQNSDPRGYLGKEEQAMVIADIDPLYAIQGQPRQQVLPASLSLVAHLPIIEDQCVEKKESLPDFWTTFERVLTETSNRSGHSSKTPNPEFHTALLGQSEVEYICTFLENLNSLVGNTNVCWMNERLEGFREHHRSHPQPLPPPVAVDWLWVETTCPDEGLPEIEIPPY
jgi:hypothetical protein